MINRRFYLSVAWIVTVCGAAPAVADVCDRSFGKEGREKELKACKFGFSVGSSTRTAFGIIEYSPGSFENSVVAVVRPKTPSSTGYEILTIMMQDGENAAQAGDGYSLDILEGGDTLLPLNELFKLEYKDGSLATVKLMGADNAWVDSDAALKTLTSDSFKDAWWNQTDILTVPQQ